ncbi:MAG: hypothetical protein CMG00_05550 [Candidatus Marinimicrobia bacterium]|nr:hypothetical protein [Candidatus Neomarinimicrobiota bacterium]|tara:strand:+ start:25706 stop:26335 length:630 start_codon:yes stop_codon:yes gene_type:complete
MVKIKSYFLFILFFLIEKTCKWSFFGREVFEKAVSSKKPVLVCAWHGYFIFPLMFFKKNFTNINVVSSNHKDSMILGSVLKKYGFLLIKGSSSRGGKNVIKEMIRLYKRSQSVIVVTNDGPKGPPRIAKSGSLVLAKKLGAKIIFISGSSSSFKKLKTWDSFILPLPFSKNSVYFEEIDVSCNMPEKEFSNSISLKMNRIQNKIDRNSF